ncbi:MAG: oligosaccharide flippase family protein [Hyphomicrobiales bacterium]|nr:oligosaccharide flippase family protein [Hyphomicrobiales bacterium]
MNFKQPNFIDLLRSQKVFTPLQGQGLKALALKGSVWTAVGFGSQKVLQFGSNLILTRILFPEAFGTMALISVFLIALTMFSDLGIKPAIIQNERGEDNSFLNTAWTIQIIRGFVLWLIACLIAWPLAQLYEQPILFPILCFVGVTAAIQGFQSTALATQNRKLQLGRLTLLPLMAQIVAVIVTVLLAWIYESVWALAVGNVVSAATNMILSHLILPSHRHRLHIERQALVTLLSFGKWIFLTTFISYFSGNGVRALQGLLVSPQDLGIIYIASMLALVVSDLTKRLANIVGLPALSQIARQDPKRMRNVLAKLRFRLLVVALPILIVISLSSTNIVDFFYDDRYAAAGQYLAILALSGALAVLPIGFSLAFLSVGDSKTPFVFSIVALVFQLSGLFFGFHWIGIEGMLVGVGAGALLTNLFVLVVVHKSNWLSPMLDIFSLILVLCVAMLIYFWKF